MVLQHNRLSRIPAAFFCLAELQVLNLNSNAITQLPEDISGLEDLRSLVVTKNRCACSDQTPSPKHLETP